LSAAKDPIQEIFLHHGGQVCQLVDQNDEVKNVIEWVSYSTNGGSALSGADYIATSGTLSFAFGETSKTFIVPIYSDSVSDGGEVVYLGLSSPTNGVPLMDPSSASLTINEN
jgi:hypothetical protein